MRPCASHAARPEPTADRDREDRQEDGDDALAAANVEGHQRRQQRQHQRADEPEPARHHGAPPQPRLAADVFDERPGRGEDIAVDRQVRRAFTGRRDEPARDPACRATTPSSARRSGWDRRRPSPPARRRWCRENGKEGPALDQRIAGRQFGAGEMVGQDAVFDRAEQRSDHSVQNDRDKQGERSSGWRTPPTASAATPISTASGAAPPRPCRSGRRVRRRGPRERRTARSASRRQA